MQHRIAQCNRYQVISLRTPIRGNKGIQNSCCAQVRFHSHVLKEVSSFPTSPNGVYNTKFGKMTRPQYVDTHEQLEKLHLVIDCALLNEQMDDQNDRNSSKRLPPVKKVLSRCGNKELIELCKCQATLYFNAKCHASQREFHFLPYALYPPNPNNTLHMYTKTFSNQVYTTDYTSRLINPNALFYERSPDFLLVSEP